MSHFGVAVFTQDGGKSVEELLQPFHEFECTGIVDEYVQSIDQLQEAREEYGKYTFTKYQAPDGKLCDSYENQFYRDPTEEESKQIGSIAGTGFGKGLSWTSKDWGDSLGYRTKIHFLPDGYNQIEVPAVEIMSFRDFIDYYYERKVVMENEEPDLNGEHKYGWIRVNAKGEVIEFIDRTNPNKKWDRWTTNGRYGGTLMVKSGEDKGYPGAWNRLEQDAISGYALVDSAKVKDIQWDAMAEKDKRYLEDKWEKMQNESEKFKNFYFNGKPNITKEEYADRGLMFATFAVVWPDGQWYEKGKMGWLACVSDEEKDWNEKYKERFLDKADPEWTLTIVDCHI